MRQSRSASISGKRPGIESRKSVDAGDGAGSADQLKINFITKVLHAIRKAKQNSILWYAKNVKYRTETILMLVATLLLYFSCSGILITRRFFVFSNSLYLLTFKLFVIGTGFLMFFTFLDIAERKRCFEFIKDMHQSGKSLPEILDFTRVNRSSKTVKFIGFVLVILNFLAVISMKDLPIPTPASQGLVQSLNVTMKNSTTIPTQDVLLAAMGMFDSCADCVLGNTGRFSFVPVSSSLLQGIEAEEENVTRRTEDIVVLNATCTSSSLMGPVLQSKKARFQIHDIQSLSNRVRILIDFSYSKNNEQFTEACVVEARDRRGRVDSKYRKGPGTLFWNAGILKIFSETTACELFDTNCLRVSTRNNLSSVLLSTSFLPGTYTVDDYVLPCQLRNGVTEKFHTKEYIRSLVGYILKLSVSNFESNQEADTIFVTSVGKDTLVNVNIQNVYLIVLSLYVVYMLFVLFRVLYRVKQITAEEIHHMKQSLYPGQFRYMTLYKVCTQVSKLKQEEVGKIIFGEDKSTTDSDEGWLRYGLAHELVPIKDDRKYMYF